MATREADAAMATVEAERANCADRFIGHALRGPRGFMGAMAHYLTVELGADRFHALMDHAEAGAAEIHRRRVRRVHSRGAVSGDGTVRGFTT